MSGKRKDVSYPPPGQRQLRVGEMLRQRLSEVLRTVDFEAKILRRASVTITEVRISPDLRQATAYIIPLGGNNMDAIVALLNQESARLKKLTLTGFHLKYTPDIHFVADRSFDTGAAMDKLLASDAVARDTRKSDVENM